MPIAADGAHAEFKPCIAPPPVPYLREDSGSGQALLGEDATASLFRAVLCAPCPGLVISDHYLRLLLATMTFSRVTSATPFCAKPRQQALQAVLPAPGLGSVISDHNPTVQVADPHEMTVSRSLSRGAFLFAQLLL